MKNLNYCWSFVFVFAMLFTSCSKEESGASVSDQDTVQLQLGALLNDFATRQANKAHDTDPTECRDANPAYVRLGLTNDATGFFVGGPGNSDPFLIRVNVKNNSGSWETEYSDVLGLPAGDYTLEYFIVYSADNEVLWVAPRAGGDYASSVGSPLPMSIDLEAGTKPYIMVDVLCYIPRNEEAYGYVFFDIDLTTVENNYCIFVNYCYDGTGRDYPAKFEVDIWADGFDGTDVVIDGEMNSVSGTGNSFAATVLCLALPPLEGNDVYYVRVRVLSAGPYTADALDFAQFTISQADINAQLLDTPRYEHVIINCGTPPDDCPSIPGDTDGDCVPNDDDNCPGFDDRLDADGDGVPDGCDVCAGGDDNIDSDSDGTPDFCDNDTPTELEDCETAFMVGNTTLVSLNLGNNRWGWVEHFEGGNGVYTYDVYAGAGQNDISKGTLVGEVELTVSDGNVAVKYTLNDGVFSNVTHIYFSDDNAPTTTAPGQYGNTYEDDYTGSKTWNFDYSNDGDFYIIVHSEVCPDVD